VLPSCCVACDQALPIPVLFLHSAGSAIALIVFLLVFLLLTPPPLRRFQSSSFSLTTPPFDGSGGQKWICGNAVDAAFFALPVLATPLGEGGTNSEYQASANGRREADGVDNVNAVPKPTALQRTDEDFLVVGGNVDSNFATGGPPQGIDYYEYRRGPAIPILATAMSCSIVVFLLDIYLIVRASVGNCCCRCGGFACCGDDLTTLVGPSKSVIVF
jgi:hypothetical protein